MNIRPIGDNILLRRIVITPNALASLYDPNTEIVSDIALPDSWRAKPVAGVVMAIGRGTLSALGHLILNTVVVGDVVLFDHRAGSEIKVNGENLLIIKETDILGVV